MEEKYAGQHGTNRPDACPYGIGRSYRQTLCGFSQQSHTYDCENKKSGNPSPPREAVSIFCPSEAIGETNLAEAGYNQHYPIHN